MFFSLKKRMKGLSEVWPERTKKKNALKANFVFFFKKNENVVNLTLQIKETTQLR